MIVSKRNILHRWLPLSSQMQENNGSGVAIMIKDIHEINEISMELFNEEIISISSKFNNKTVCFFSYYSPPNKELNIELFKYIQHNSKNYVIMGNLSAKNEIFNSKIGKKNGDLLN